MIVKRNNTSYVVVLAKGEELHACLQAFAQQESITSAWVQGLGGALEACLGYYSLESKQYHQHQLNQGPYEITGLQGNIALKEGDHVLHLHASLGDASLQTQTGHIHSLVVGGTLELLITPLSTQLERSHNNLIGLDLIS